jgi:hypothetical protein
LLFAPLRVFWIFLWTSVVYALLWQYNISCTLTLHWSYPDLPCIRYIFKLCMISYSVVCFIYAYVYIHEI